MELKDKNSQQEKSKYKLHTKSPLCKKWQENTLKKLETLKIIKLSKKNLINLLKQTNKKPNLEEKIQIMSMLCLLLDSSIPLSTKKMFIEGAKNISPVVNFFKKVFLNFINKNIVKKTIIEEKNIIKNKNSSKKGILNWSLAEILDYLIKNIIKKIEIFVNFTNNNIPSINIPESNKILRKNQNSEIKNKEKTIETHKIKNNKTTEIKNNKTTEIKNEKQKKVEKNTENINKKYKLTSKKSLSWEERIKNTKSVKEERIIQK